MHQSCISGNRETIITCISLLFLFVFVGPLFHPNQTQPWISTLTLVNCAILSHSHPLLLHIVSFFLSSLKWHWFEPYLWSTQTDTDHSLFSNESISGCGMGTNMHSIPPCVIFLFSIVVFYYICGKLWKLVCTSGSLSADQPILKSHFSGILHFIIQMTSSKNCSPQ